MVREIVKLAAAAAIILIAGFLVALFASGYISAFKPGGTTEPPGEHVVGGGGSIGSGASIAGTPVPSPLPQPGPEMPETLQMSPGPEPAMPAAQPCQPPLMPQAIAAPGTLQGQIMPPARPPEGPVHAPGPDARIVGDRPMPVQPGWLKVTSWLIWLMPILFPSLFPGWTWWTQDA